MHIGVQLYSLREYIQENGLEEGLRMIAEAGFTGVEFAGFYGKSENEIQELLNRYHLYPISAHVGVEDMQEQIPMLKQMGIECPVIPYQPFNMGISFEEGLSACKKAQELLRGFNMNIGYHNHAHEFKDGTDMVAKLAENIPELKLELDIFWLAVAGISATDYMRAHKDRLIYLHIKELGESADSINPIVGQGRANVAEVMRLGKEFGIEWSILEVENVDIPMSDYLKQSFKFMKKFA